MRCINNAILDGVHDGMRGSSGEPLPALWEQQPGEPAKAYALAQRYFASGTERSLRKLALDVRMHYSYATLKKYSSLYGWVRRAKAYDQHMFKMREKVQQRAGQDMAQEDAQRWARRFAQTRELQWDIAQQLLQKAREVLETSVEEKGWKPGDAVACSKMAAQLMEQLAAAVAQEGESDSGAETVIRVEYVGGGDTQ